MYFLPVLLFALFVKDNWDDNTYLILGPIFSLFIMLSGKKKFNALFSHSLLVEMQNGTTTLGDSLAVS